MSKLTTLLMSLVILTLISATGFLAVEVSKLNDLYYSHISSEQQRQADSAQISQSIQQLHQNAVNNELRLKDLSASMTLIAKERQDAPGQDYMPAPEYAVKASIYQIKQDKSNQMSVIGNKNELKAWKERNEVFLDYVMKKSMLLDYDKQSQNVFVDDIVAGSVFYQMGLRKGDRILTVNGKRLLKGADIRDELTNSHDMNLSISRNNKKVLVAIAYRDMPLTAKNEVVLDISKEQFDTVLASIVENIKTAPALSDGDILGVKLLAIDARNLFSVMRFQPQDIITRVNGDKVSQNRLLSALKSADDPFEIDYIRGDQANKILIKFIKK